MKTLFALLFLAVFSNWSIAQDVELLFVEASTARDDMDFEKATVIYSKILDLEPNNIEALYYRGWVKSFDNPLDGIDDFLRVLELDSNHVGALKGASSYYAFKEDHEAAEYYENKAIEAEPQSAESLLNLAKKARKNKEYEKALELCDQSIKKDDPSNVWIPMLERAEILMLLGRNEEAITVFESCFNDYGYGMYMCGNYEKCGDAYRAIGHMTEACMYWNIAIKNDDPEFDPASPGVKIKVMENCN